MTTYDAVLFDNDGILVELTESRILREAALAAFRDVGIDDPADRYVDHAVEETLDDLRTLEAEYDASFEEYWRARERRAIEHQCEAIENGRKPLHDDVEELADLPHRLGVVSNNQHETVAFIVDHHDLTDLFEVVSGREPTYDGARRRKPDPHYIDAALDELGIREALYVGDSAKDVIAAHRAGIDAAFVDRPHHESVGLDHEPAYHVTDLTELVARLRA